MGDRFHKDSGVITETVDGGIGVDTVKKKKIVRLREICLFAT